MRKRYDLTIKGMLRRNGMEIIRYGGASKARIINDGIEVQQVYGEILIDARGLYTKEEIMEVIKGLDVKVTIYSAKVEEVVVDEVVKSEEEVEMVLRALIMNASFGRVDIVDEDLVRKVNNLVVNKCTLEELKMLVEKFGKEKKLIVKTLDTGKLIYRKVIDTPLKDVLENLVKQDTINRLKELNVGKQPNHPIRHRKRFSYIDLLMLSCGNRSEFNSVLLDWDRHGLISVKEWGNGKINGKCSVKEFVVTPKAYEEVGQKIPKKRK